MFLLLLQSECYVEGYATTFNAPYLLYEFEDGTKIYERIDAHALDSADMSDVIMQYDHEGSSNRRVRKRVQAVTADTTTLTEKMRAALRISSTSEKITEEINDCIAACKADMKNDGVKVIKETDGLIIRAITLYCKAEFGFNNAAEQFRKSYDALKMRLSLSAEYNTAPQVSETDTNSTESGV